MRRRNATALKEWAVTCDALARGEQILLLRDAEIQVRRPSVEATEAASSAPWEDGLDLPAREFWLYPTWDEQRIADLADPYRDRARRLLELHRDDGRLRLRYYATVEYGERVRSRDRLLALDVEHTLNAPAVEELYRGGAFPGAWLLLLRVYERRDTAVLREHPDYRRASPWVTLQAPVSTGQLKPVISDRVFLKEKARLLQLAGSIEAM